MLVDGRWNTRDRITDERGRYVREPAAFRCELGPTGAAARQTGAEAGRYRLYVSYACPWAHRTLIVRAAKRLDRAIGIRVVDPVWGEQGWRLDPDPGAAGEPPDLRYLHQIYTRARPDYTGRVTVPVLWVNSADDFINPPELGLAQQQEREMPRARFILIPASPETKGHGTHTWARFWKAELAQLLAD